MKLRTPKFLEFSMNFSFVYGVIHKTNEFILPKTPARPCIKIWVVDVARNLGLRVWLFSRSTSTQDNASTGKELHNLPCTESDRTHNLSVRL